MLYLPDEIIGVILEYALGDNNDKALIRTSCKRLNEIISASAAPSPRRDNFKLNFISLPLLQWGINHEWNGDPFACEVAAEGGRLDALKFLRKNNCQWDEFTCSNAALGGHLEVLRWARENGCPWDEWTCANAAKGGHLEVLRWARENGCPWDDWTCSFAASEDNLEIFLWASNGGCPIDYRKIFHYAKKPIMKQWFSLHNDLRLPS